MNKVIITGRLTKDVDTRYSQGDNQTAISRYTVAVNRKFKREGEADADFFNVVAFGKLGEFAEKYFHKGMRVEVTGHLQNGSYTDKDGIKRYTTDIIAEEQDFGESKSASSNSEPKAESSNMGFMNIPEGIDEELPFASPTR